MELALRRVIIFTADLEGLAVFYGEVLGLPRVSDEISWKAFDAGAIEIALHNGSAMLGRRPPKLVFYAADVAGARAVLNARGARFGAVKSGAGFDLSDGKDPDGNPIQLSSRA